MTSPEPVIAAFASRVRADLAASFAADRPMRICLAPGRLDVMGGLAAVFGGAMFCHATLGSDCSAAVAIQARDAAHRTLQVFSFDLYDQQKPFTLMVPMPSLGLPLETLRREFADPGRTWAAAVAGCLAILHDAGHIDLRDAAVPGFTVAVQNEIPADAGLADAAALIATAMVAFVDELHLRDKLDALAVAHLCRRVDVELMGGDSELEAYVAAVAGEASGLTRMTAQDSASLAAPLQLPEGVGVVAIDSGVRPTAADRLTCRRTRAAAGMGHKLIIEKMRQIGQAAGRELVADPTRGHLANLPLADYKRFFRPFLPEGIRGGQFLLQHRGIDDRSVTVEPDVVYPVQQATDLCVFDANRIREFARYIEEAGAAPAAGPERTLLLDKAGHLLYASHVAYFKDAQLPSEACDWLVDTIRQREWSGFYGARMTAAGSGGTVAVLCDQGQKADDAIAEIVATYTSQTGNPGRAYLGSRPGAWTAGTAIV